MDPLQETFGDKLKELCSDRFGGIPGFAKKHDLNPQTLYSGLRKTPAVLSSKALLAFSEEFDLDPLALGQERIVPKGPKFVNVPLYGSIAAGQPLEMLQTTDFYPVSEAWVDKFPGAFLLRVNGESMNRSLPNGCFALIEPCSEVIDSGKPYVVAVGESEATVKRVRVLNNGIELIPDSTDPTFKPQLYDYGVPGTEQIRIIGRVVWYCLPDSWQF